MSVGALGICWNRGVLARPGAQHSLHLSAPRQAQVRGCRTWRGIWSVCVSSHSELLFYQEPYFKGCLFASLVDLIPYRLGDIGGCKVTSLGLHLPICNVETHNED